ncbi:MAG: hypothetical protein ACSLE5_15540, partial [Porticoccaceae bacterium]
MPVVNQYLAKPLQWPKRVTHLIALADARLATSKGINDQIIDEYDQRIEAPPSRIRDANKIEGIKPEVSDTLAFHIAHRDRIGRAAFAGGEAFPQPLIKP